MDDLEDIESWHEDLRTWERFQDELKRIIVKKKWFANYTNGI